MAPVKGVNFWRLALVLFPPPLCKVPCWTVQNRPMEHDHLATEHLGSDLGGRSVRGGIAILAVQTAQFALNLGSTAILARLLTPGDFGLVAMAAAVGSFFMLFLDMGL